MKNSLYIFKIVSRCGSSAALIYHFEQESKEELSDIKKKQTHGRTVSLKGNFVHLTFPNNVMLEEVKINKGHVLNFLRKKLNNYQILFDLILNEEDEKKFVYTPEERYNKLREINPLFDEFRKTFYLDI